MASSKNEDHSETQERLHWPAESKRTDEALLAKLSVGDLDLVAIGAKYHSSCLASLYNKAKSASTENSQSDYRALKGNVWH